VASALVRPNDDGVCAILLSRRRHFGSLFQSIGGVSTGGALVVASIVLFLWVFVFFLIYFLMHS
jgi:uncharacterized BrkB/YihY/UPF0761 family membrane protein